MAQTKCKGLYFRFKKSAYFHKTLKSITFKQEVKLLKRQSCKGCPECNWVFDRLAEDWFGEDLGRIAILDSRNFSDGDTLKLFVKYVSQDQCYFTFDYSHLYKESQQNIPRCGNTIVRGRL